MVRAQGARRVLWAPPARARQEGLPASGVPLFPAPPDDGSRDLFPDAAASGHGWSPHRRGRQDVACSRRAAASPVRSVPTLR